MRHGKTHNHLGRTNTHRKAMLANMASSLILHKRITTTLAKARELRKYVEPLITKSKNDTTHSRRTVFSYLKDKETTSILFREVAEKVANRPGGYTRILKLENRMGDNAEMALIELVDYNELYTSASTQVAEKKTTRRRGGKGKKAESAGAVKAEAATEEPAVTDVAEEPVAAEEVSEEPAASAEETSSPDEASEESKDKEKGE